MGYYHYIGDTESLINNGWKYQKLYAGEYESYMKGDVIMFISNDMVIEIDDIHPEIQPDVIEFILDNRHQPEYFWQSTLKNNSIFKDTKFACWLVQNGKIVTRPEAMKNKITWMKKAARGTICDPVEDGHSISYDLVKTILELRKIGGIKYF